MHLVKEQFFLSLSLVTCSTELLQHASDEMATTKAAVKFLVDKYSITNVSQRGIKVTNRSAHLVKELRDKFMEEYNKEKDLYHETDIRKVLTDDWYVKRFLLARNRDVNESCQMMMEALKWKKSEGIHDLDGSYFPAEQFKLSSLFVYAPDKEGNITIKRNQV